MNVFNALAPRAPRKKIAKRQQELRTRLWPEIGPDWVWSRHTHDGFTTLPKGMPLILSIMDDMAKGQPVSTTYLDLWCRTFEESFVTLSKPREMAFHAGFDGQRAERTWKQRLTILAELGFISLKEGPSGPASYALVLNPYKVIKWHYDAKHAGVRKDKFHALLERAIEIGDESMSPPAPPPEPAPAVVSTGFGPALPMPANWPVTPPTIPPVATGGSVVPVQSVAPEPAVWPWPKTPVE
jgi:hypothetical protein